MTSTLPQCSPVPAWSTPCSPRSHSRGFSARPRMILTTGASKSRRWVAAPRPRGRAGLWASRAAPVWRQPPHSRHQCPAHVCVVSCGAGLVVASGIAPVAMEDVGTDPAQGLNWGFSGLVWRGLAPGCSPLEAPSPGWGVWAAPPWAVPAPSWLCLADSCRFSEAPCPCLSWWSNSRPTWPVPMS